MVVADDHAAHAISTYDDRLLQTPQLDRLAAEGMRFDNCFCTNSLCAPSRAVILTGTYSHLNGVRTLSTPFDARQPTFVSLLREAGYRTALVGKWHLGHGGVHDPRGFDTWQVLEDQGEYWDPEFLVPGGRRRLSGYATTVITDLAIEQLHRRDDDRPLCLLVWHKAPHRPWDPDDKHAEHFAGHRFPEPTTLFDGHSGHASAARAARMRVGRDLTDRDLKGSVPAGLAADDRTRWALQRYLEDYLRCVVALDEQTGRLLDVVEDSGREGDTVVMYTSDQGFFLGDHGWYDKRFMYEESLRMPLLVRYPALVAAGTSSDALVLNVDFAQTLLELAGVPAHPRMQGHSLVPILRGVRPLEWRDCVYYRYWEHDDGIHHVWAHDGVRTRTHKLVRYYADGLGLPGTSRRAMPVEWELFDLQTDPSELRSVYDDPAYAAVRDELTVLLARVQREVGDDPPPSSRSGSGRLEPNGQSVGEQNKTVPRQRPGQQGGEDQRHGERHTDRRRLAGAGAGAGGEADGPAGQADGHVAARKVSRHDAGFPPPLPVDGDQLG
ncbi:MAG TPA: sulfatase [Asanoa sp.]